MFCKEEELDMTPTSFSMSTILTEKEKMNAKEIDNVAHQNEEKEKCIDDDLPKKEELSSEAKHVHVNLDDSELWKKFKTLTNEMIVTKNGRYIRFI